MKFTTVAGLVLSLGIYGVCQVPTAAAAENRNAEIKHVQQSLIDKGFQAGAVDGVMGPRTRAGLRDYQKSENLPVTGRLDVETAGKLGVGPESIGGNMKSAGHEVAEGSREAGHEVTEGKPLAAGKEFGKGIGRAGEKLGKGIKGIVTTESDRGSREARPKP